MAERDLYPAILLDLTRDPTVRLFRINAGVAWQGKVIEQSASRLVLGYPRAVQLGPEGMSDLIGWSNGARFTAIEGKAKGSYPNASQRAFIAAVINAGGIAGVARSVDDARCIIETGL